MITENSSTISMDRDGQDIRAAPDQRSGVGDTNRFRPGTPPSAVERAYVKIRLGLPASTALFSPIPFLIFLVSQFFWFPRATRPFFIWRFDDASFGDGQHLPARGCGVGR
jgi:hypothetical protein